MERLENTVLPETGMQIVLEVFFMTLSAPASIRSVVRRKDITTRGIDPDDGVLELIAQAQDDGVAVKREQCFIHSTSWRYEPERTIVLTYLAYSDHLSFPEEAGTVFQPADVPPATSADPGRPRPPEIKEVHVAAHAIRHLSFLAKNGQGALHDILKPETLRFLQAIDDLPAGMIRGTIPTTVGVQATAARSFRRTGWMNRTPALDTVPVIPRP